MNYYDRLRQFRLAMEKLLERFRPTPPESSRGGIDGMGNYCKVLKIAPKFPVEHMTEFEIEAQGWEITRPDREAVFRALGATTEDLALLDKIEAERLAKVPKERLMIDSSPRMKGT